MHDLLRLDDHLPLFFGGAVVQEDVDLRDAVERDAVRELLDVELLAHEEVARLRVELLHRRRARTGCGLVGGDDDALDRREVVRAA